MAASGHWDETRDFTWTKDNEEDAARLFVGLVGISALGLAILVGVTFVGKTLITRMRHS